MKLLQTAEISSNECLFQKINEVMNNYNLIFLYLYQANMDIQPYDNITVVVYYVAKYSNKCESHDI